MDQLVNSAAKWNYMFGGKTPVPITIRLIVGKGLFQRSLLIHMIYTLGLRIFLV